MTNTNTYPKVIYAWMGEMVQIDGEPVAFSAASLTMYAQSKGLIPKRAREITQRFRIMTGRLVRDIQAETEIEGPGDVPIPAWYAATWTRVLLAYGPKPRRFLYMFLIARCAGEGGIHHPNSLSWLICDEDIGTYGLKACNLDVARFNAKRALAAFRRKFIEAKPSGKLGVKSKRKTITQNYDAWPWQVWQAACMASQG